MIKKTSNKFILYIIAIIILFIIPIITIITNYNTLKSGEVFIFKVRSYDPYDVFRGNYMNIVFDENSVINTSNIIDTFKKVYVEIGKNNDGFGYFKSISNTKPKNTKTYFKTNCNMYSYNESKKKYVIDTPNRYYMNEKKSKMAEEILNKNIKNAYVKVSVKNGKMNVIGLYINGILIDECI